MEKVISISLLFLCACGIERLRGDDIYSLSTGPKVIVYGQVTHSGTGAPLEGASIQIEGASAQTDANGTYRIDDLHTNEVIGSASLHGFKPASFTLSLHGGANSHDIALIPQDCGRYGCATSQYCDDDNGMCVDGATLSGTVIDACSGEAIDAKVTVAGQSGCTSPLKAYFQLTNLTPGGPHVLAAGKLGFLPFSTQITLKPGLNAFEPIRLQRRDGCTATPPASVCTCDEANCQR